MTPIAYTGFWPTKFFHGLGWFGPNIALIGVEIAPEAFGIVICGVWIGVVKDGT